jgi:CTP synthase
LIEYARNVLGLKDANSSEFAADTSHPVVCMLEEQRTISDKGGTMRLGAQPCLVAEESHAFECYGESTVMERHRHRYEYNPEYRTRFEEAGLTATGLSPSGNLAEIIEIPNHPWFLAVQFHPEFKSKPHQPHPLFAGFVGAALVHQAERGRAMV